MYLGDRTKDEVAALLAKGPVVAIVPIGSVEPHGPHLPLATDTIISVKAAEIACARLLAGGTSALVAPPIPYGVTDFAAGFAGAVSIEATALSAFLKEVAAAFLRAGFAHVAYVNNHLEPEHDRAVRDAIATLEPGRASVACPLTRRWARTLSVEFKSGACHAGQYETSLVLAAREDLVRKDLSATLSEVPVSLSEGIRQGMHTFREMGMANAYAGAPALASEDEGRALYEKLADMVVGNHRRARDTFLPWEHLIMFEKDGPTFMELIRQALQSTRGGYEMLAPKFDKTPFRTPDAVAKRSIELLGDPVRSALDICSGTGSGLLALKPFTTERLVGVDFSPAMIAESKRALGIESPLAANESPRIELVEKDVFAIDFDKEFEAATCFGAFGHIPSDRESEFLGLVRRALVPGGRFVFVTGTKPRIYDPRAFVAHGFNAAMRVRNALISPPFVMYYLTFLLPDIERKLKWTGFDASIHTKLFDPPFEEMVAIVARRI